MGLVLATGYRVGTQKTGDPADISVLAIGFSANAHLLAPFLRAPPAGAVISSMGLGHVATAKIRAAGMRLTAAEPVGDSSQLSPTAGCFRRTIPLTSLAIGLPRIPLFESV
jgi:hypothetical protein